MSLLYAGIDYNHIKPLGHWRSDEMILYLHVQAVTFTPQYTRAMVTHDDYFLIPNQ